MTVTPFLLKLAVLTKKMEFVRWKDGCVQVVYVAPIMTKAHYYI